MNEQQIFNAVGRTIGLISMCLVLKFIGMSMVDFCL